MATENDGALELPPLKPRVNYPLSVLAWSFFGSIFSLFLLEAFEPNEFGTIGGTIVTLIILTFVAFFFFKCIASTKTAREQLKSKEYSSEWNKAIVRNGFAFSFNLIMVTLVIISFSMVQLHGDNTIFFYLFFVGFIGWFSLTVGSIAILIHDYRIHWGIEKQIFRFQHMIFQKTITVKFKNLENPEKLKIALRLYSISLWPAIGLGFFVWVLIMSVVSSGWTSGYYTIPPLLSKGFFIPILLTCIIAISLAIPSSIWLVYHGFTKLSIILSLWIILWLVWPASLFELSKDRYGGADGSDYLINYFTIFSPFVAFALAILSRIAYMEYWKPIVIGTNGWNEYEDFIAQKSTAQDLDTVQENKKKRAVDRTVLLSTCAICLVFIIVTGLTIHETVANEWDTYYVPQHKPIIEYELTNKTDTTYLITITKALPPIRASEFSYYLESSNGSIIESGKVGLQTIDGVLYGIDVNLDEKLSGNISSDNQFVIYNNITYSIPGADADAVRKRIDFVMERNGNYHSVIFTSNNLEYWLIYNSSFVIRANDDYHPARPGDRFYLWFDLYGEQGLMGEPIVLT